MARPLSHATTPIRQIRRYPRVPVVSCDFPALRRHKIRRSGSPARLSRHRGSSHRPRHRNHYGNVLQSRRAVFPSAHFLDYLYRSTNFCRFHLVRSTLDKNRCFAMEALHDHRGRSHVLPLHLGLVRLSKQPK